MNETKRIDPSMLDGKEPIAVGYKIFGWDWTGYNDYSYADENGEVEGSVHTVTGDLKYCGWGLHYCENPVDCMRYRGLIQWNKFALVEAYDENIKRDNDDKSVCRTLKIKKVLSFDDMIKACREYQTAGIRNGISNGYGISYGDGICYGNGISYGYGVNISMHCRKCEGISRCIFCDGLEGARLMIFNKPVTVERFDEVWDKLNEWKPDFTNAQQLKRKYGGNDGWANTPVFKIIGRKASEVYAEMPRELRDYIKAMPEYDDEIFKTITGEADE